MTDKIVMRDSPEATVLNGKTLYGDDFDANQIEEWYADEKEAYAELGAGNASTYKYGYHALNTYHAYRHLREKEFKHVLGFGSAYGDEFIPIISKIGKLTIVDPSDAFANGCVHGIPANYIKPDPSGTLALPDETFDLITCLGVLHHIPNVSFVFSELARTLKPGGTMLVREPINSMGDWRKPRRGVTKRERGIPIDIMNDIVQESGLEIVRSSLCQFPVTPRLSKVFGPVYNSEAAVRLDAVMSKAFAWNVNYHPRNAIQRLRPTSVFMILRRP